MAQSAGRLSLVHDCFGNMADHLDPGSIDGIALDIGVSSMQIDEADRGFSFRQDGPLDMRMNPKAATRARDLVNDLSQNELERIFREYGEERQARRASWS